MTAARAGAAEAVVGLGANAGSPAGGPDRTVRAALAELRSLAAGPVRASGLYRTEPVGCPAGTPPFINAVALVPSALTPEALLEALQAIEARYGRVRNGRRDAVRPLDLDLISFGAARRAGPGLVLPHPAACRRRFVLAPLAELRPELVLPGQRETVRALLDRLPPVPRATRCAPPPAGAPDGAATAGAPSVPEARPEESTPEE